MTKSKWIPWLASALFLLTTLVAAGCERRETRRIAGGMPRTADVRQIELQPGQPVATTPFKNPYEDNPSALAEGKRLYGWYNCAGCHFAGGGGIGPPLMDDDWIYGGDTQNILASMMEGRPDGMPSYRGRLPQEHALKIAAYVRSLSQEKEPEIGRTEATEDTGEARRKELEKESPPLGRPTVEQEESHDRSP